MSPDVLIVGGGLAGLACGQRLAACGVPFQILETDEAIGGRLRTDLINGFRLDRTFPLYLQAFPEGRRVLDLDLLDLKSYSRAALIRFSGKFHRIGDPRSEPFAASKSLANPIGSFRDKLRLIRFFWELDRGKTEPARFDAERPALDLLRWNGRFRPAMIDRFFRPLAGMLCRDRSLATSSAKFRFALRMLRDGPAVVPALGMQAISDQLAANLPPECIRLETKVERLGFREVILANGEAIPTRAVVLATNALMGETPTESRTATILHYSAEHAPIAEPIIVLDGDGTGPVNHLAVPSNLSSAYAPAGRALIAAEVIEEQPTEAAELDRRARIQIAEWFGAAVSSWKLLRIHRESAAMFNSPPVRLRPGLYQCGAGTFDDEFMSGFHAAQAAMEDLHAKLA